MITFKLKGTYILILLFIIFFGKRPFCFQPSMNYFLRFSAQSKHIISMYTSFLVSWGKVRTTRLPVAECPIKMVFGSMKPYITSPNLVTFTWLQGSVLAIIKHGSPSHRTIKRRLILHVGRSLRYILISGLTRTGYDSFNKFYVLFQVDLDNRQPPIVIPKEPATMGFEPHILMRGISDTTTWPL